MRIRTSILLALTATVLAASAADIETLVDEGVVLHDQGRLDEAEAKFRAALSLDEGHLRARYELAFTLFELGRYRECVDEALTVTRRESPIQAGAFGMVGTCWDQLGEPKRALKAYEKGLKLEPGEPMLNFNYAVTLAARDRAPDAVEAAKIAAGGRPDWSSAQLLLARLYHGAGLRVPAMLCALRFLVLEPASGRTALAGQIVAEQLQHGVDRKSDSEVTISLDAQSNTAEGDFRAVEMMMAIVTASWSTEEMADSTDAAKLASAVGSVADFLTESEVEGVSDVLADNIAFVRELRREGLLEPAVYRALGFLEVDGAAAWLEANAGRVAQLDLWLIERTGN